MMEDSMLGLLNELCCRLVEESVCSDPLQKKILVKKFRKHVFETIINDRHLFSGDGKDNDSADVVVDILGHIYSNQKYEGDWCKQTVEDIKALIDKAEDLAKKESSIGSVLKFLLCLADSTQKNILHQEPSYGLDIKKLIKGPNLKHRSLMKSPLTFHSEIFELPEPSKYASNLNLQMLGDLPGSGLKHHQFFITPSASYSCTKLSNIDEHDITNANWVIPRLENKNSSVGLHTNSRGSMHQDEGYVTPDQDIPYDEEYPVIHWEDMYKREFIPVYSWENFGEPVFKKENLFIFQIRDATEQICKVIHASDSFSLCSNETLYIPNTLKTISVGELEVAFKNLLLGVESTVFQYDHTKCSFVLQKCLQLNGLSRSTLEKYCEDFIECGNRFKELELKISTSIRSGLILQTLCNNIRQYLQCYRGVVLAMPKMISLLNIHDWLHKLSTQLQFLLSLWSSSWEDNGSALMTHLYNEVLVLNRHDLSYVYYFILQSCCSLYFRFLSKWIFEGVTDNTWMDEFFIKSKPLTDKIYNHKFWYSGFELNQSLVPGFLRELKENVLLCGKSMALLKLCSPDDPVCREIKKESPEIVCCFNKTDLVNIENKFNLYKETCKKLCQEVFGSVVSQCHEEDYYATLRTKSLNKIKENQKAERRLKAEKKLFEFNLLKKNMEDASTRKKEEKQSLLEEEEKILKEAQEVEKLNDLRRKEERKKLVDFYSAVSETADRRKELAEWKIKRAQLYDKRSVFLKEDNIVLEMSLLESRNRKTLESDQFQLVSAEKSLAKYLDTYNSELDQTNYVTSDTEVVKEQKEDYKALDPQVENISVESFLVTNDKCEMEVNNLLENTNIVNDEKREWLIALDIADKARQSALKFKQRNMYNNYNILTGEESTFEKRFGERGPESDEIISENSNSPSSNTNSPPNLSEVPQTINLQSCKMTANELTSISKKLSGDKVKSFDKESYETASSNSRSFESTQSSMEPVDKNIDLMVQDIQNEDCSSKDKVDCLDIDMTSIYQNLQKSVMIPLLTQLELANDGLLRLFCDKHNLLKHIECIWKYFFLLEGEFSRNLTRKLFKDIQNLQHPSYLLNVLKLNSLLRCALGSNVDEEFTERLSFFVKESDIPPVFRLIDPDTLDCLSMRYKTYWPINIVITEELILRQDKIFKFLLKLNRISWALEEMIYLLKDKRYSSSEQYKQVQLFRHIMSNFIVNFKNYISVAALQETWIRFNQQFKKASTLDDICCTYMRFIREVKFRCMLGESARKGVRIHLTKLFKSVLIFHETLRSNEWTIDVTSGHYQHPGYSRIVDNFKNFIDIARYLLHVFKKTAATGYQREIGQLVTMLSLNNFYNYTVQQQ